MIKNNITLYSKKDCPDCTSAKALLTRKNMSYNEMVLGEDLSKEDFMLLFPDVKAMPYIRVNGDRIGGYKDLIEWVKQQPELLLE